MGARASVASDQQPLGTSAKVVVTIGEDGTELSREVVPDPPGLVLRVVQFVDLDDDARVTTEAFGVMTLSVSRTCTLDELGEELREFIFEDELREVDEDLGDEPRWEEMSAALRREGIAASDASLLALPFVVEIDDEVSAELSRCL